MTTPNPAHTAEVDRLRQLAGITDHHDTEETAMHTDTTDANQGAQS